jgi:hypothetical protein
VARHSKRTTKSSLFMCLVKIYGSVCNPVAETHFRGPTRISASLDIARANPVIR